MLVDIKGYEGLYKINKEGDVFSLRSNKFLKPMLSNVGYYRVFLYKDREKRRMSVHRLVALTFLAPMEGLLYVNHKDCIRTNNNVENLEWCDFSKNNQHAYDVGNQEHTKQIHARRMRKMTIDEASEIFEAYDTGLFYQREIAESVGISQSQISRLLSHKSYKIAV